MSFFQMCCGEGEEEEKFGSVVDVSDYEWGRRGGAGGDDTTTSLRGEEKKSGERIKSLENQIAVVNRHKPKGERETIRSKPLCLAKTCNYQAPQYPKSDTETQFLETAFANTFVFMDLEDQERNMLTLAMQKEVVKAGTTIIQQGDDKADFFYIVQTGTVDFVDGNTSVGTTCQAGGSFGELSLLYDSPRAVSCVAKTDCILWKVDQATFKYIIAHNVHKHHQSVQDIVRNIDMFKSLDAAIVNRFANAMTPVKWKRGDRIVQKGEVGNVFYIITQGKVKVHDIGLGDSQFDDQYMEEGESFGERALLTGEPRAANITAVSEHVKTLAMDRDTFEELIGPMQSLLETDMRTKFLKSIPLFEKANLSKVETEQLVALMTEVCYRKGEKLAEPGKPYPMSIWIVRHGTILIYNAENPYDIFKIKSGDYFGDKSIRRDPSHISTHTAVCEDNLTAWVITRADIEHVVGDIRRLTQVGAEPLPFVRSPQPEPTLQLADLTKHRVLGMGAFGKVWLVTPSNDKKTTYALKEILKRKVIDSQQVESVIREKKLLALIQHPFILNLVGAFQDEYNLYLLLPLISGGELYSALQRSKKRNRGRSGMTNAHAAFYAACIIEALGHLHQRQIAYRDLKLENVLIDADGFCVLVDLGFAKMVSDKTFTLVGTPEYLAPEIIMSKGHDKAVDYWSYGVLVYELLVGTSPFYQRGSTRMDMFKRIVLVNYKTPNYVSETASNMIANLLERRPANRLGNLANGYIDIKKDDWFAGNAAWEGIDFKSILNKSATPPWKPEIKESNPLDLSGSFDDYSGRENGESSFGKRLVKEEQDLFLDF